MKDKAPKIKEYKAEYLKDYKPDIVFNPVPWVNAPLIKSDISIQP